MSKYIDIHAHTNFVAFDEDRDAVISRALDNDTWVINIGTQYDTSKKAVEMTGEYKEGVYATIGLHPIHTDKSYHDTNELGQEGKTFVSRGEVFDKEKYRELAKLGKVVAIGECGLDYYHIGSAPSSDSRQDISPQGLQESIEKQRIAFIEQIELANELNLPLMLHIRNSDENLEMNAYQDVLKIIKKYTPTNSARAEFVGVGKDKKIKGVIHFFAGTLKDAKDFIDLGFYISFAGVITYPPKKNDPRKINYEEIIKELPLDRIMADTDSPYVAPVPYRGKRNEPFYVKEIVKKIAEIKQISEEEMAKIIFQNAQRLFNFPDSAPDSA